MILTNKHPAIRIASKNRNFWQNFAALAINLGPFINAESLQNQILQSINCTPNNRAKWLVPLGNFPLNGVTACLLKHRISIHLHGKCVHCIFTNICYPRAQTVDWYTFFISPSDDDPWYGPRDVRRPNLQLLWSSRCCVPLCLSYSGSLRERGRLDGFRFHAGTQACWRLTERKEVDHSFFEIPNPLWWRSQIVSKNHLVTQYHLATFHPSGNGKFHDQLHAAMTFVYTWWGTVETFTSREVSYPWHGNPLDSSLNFSTGWLDPNLRSTWFKINGWFRTSERME